jgi:hypothetical protein
MPHLFVIIATAIKWLLYLVYMILLTEARISDYFELYIWRFVLGPFAETWLFETYVPWFLDTTSKILVLWWMNLWLQYLFQQVDKRIPKPDIVEYIPEFSPPQVIHTFFRHVIAKNPITFVYRLIRRIILAVKVAFYCNNIAYVSQKISEASTRFPDMRRELLKFGKTIPMFKNHSGHSHPKSAAFRSAVNEWMKDVAQTAGYTPYSVSMSSSDQIGNRFYYNTKDLSQTFTNDPVPDNAMLIFTDVDYYANMPDWLCLNRPIMMYTFAPSTLAGSTDEYAFRTVGDCVEYSVSGGAVYRHRLWDYKGDCMTVKHPYTNEVMAFNVEQRTIQGDPDHRIVLLTPTATVQYPENLYLIGHQPLKRKRYSFSPHKQEVLAMFDPLTKILSLAIDGAYSSVEIQIDIFNAIRARMAAKAALQTVGDVERYLSQQGDPQAVIKAPLLFWLLESDFRPNVVSTSEVIVSFQPFSVNDKNTIVADDGSAKMKAVSPPIFSEPALAPVKCISSDISSVNGRVTNVKNTVVPPAYYRHLKSEFVRALLGNLAGTGTSLEISEVVERQSKKAQRIRNANAAHALSEVVKGPLQTFIKAEPYGAPNEPRTITTVPQEVTTLLSEYTYSMKDAVLKKLQWYGPCKEPLATIDRLQTLIGDDGAISTDFSRFDGTISEFLQDVAKSVYMTYFVPEQRRRLGNLYKAVFTKTAFTENGLKYDAGHGTRSGSPITTDANTIINAFVMYCSLRKLNLSIQDAMANIGLVCGDDGFMRNRPGLAESLDAVCKDLGLKLKPEIHKEGPYPYLGRFFCDPRTTKTSFQDPKRTMQKIHLTSNKNVSDAQARVNKCLGYLATDKLTPIIGDYCRKAIQQLPDDPKGTVYAGKNFTGEEEFKMTNAWPQDEADVELIKEQFCKLCSLEASELEKRIALVRDASDIMKVPILFDNERATKIVAEVDGLIEYPGGSHQSKDEPTAPRPRNGNNSASGANSTRPGEDSSRPPKKNGGSKRKSKGRGNAPDQQRQRGDPKSPAKPNDRNLRTANAKPGTGNNRFAALDVETRKREPAASADSSPKERKPIGSNNGVAKRQQPVGVVKYPLGSGRPAI